MRVAVLAAALLPLVMSHPLAHADAPEPPYVADTEWVKWGDLWGLRVYPTAAGRAATTDFVDADQAWSEVLADAPEADLPGMRDQFVCHWQLAEFGAPGKTSWNLEPWRPIVDADAMMLAGCNPGGIEEPS